VPDPFFVGRLCVEVSDDGTATKMPVQTRNTLTCPPAQPAMTNNGIQKLDPRWLEAGLMAWLIVRLPRQTLSQRATSPCMNIRSDHSRNCRTKSASTHQAGQLHGLRHTSPAQRISAGILALTNTSSVLTRHNLAYTLLALLSLIGRARRMFEWREV